MKKFLAFFFSFLLGGFFRLHVGEEEKGIFDELKSVFSGFRDDLKEVKEAIGAPVQAPTKEEIDKQITDQVSKQVEQILKEMHGNEPGDTGGSDDGDDAPEAAKYYGLLNAQQEVLKGRKTLAVNWNEKRQKRFVEWAIAVKSKDYAFIRKAFGDNAISTANNPLVPDEFRPELLRLTWVKSLMLSKVTIWPMAGDTLTVPTGGTMTAQWLDANTQGTDQDPGFSSVELNAKKLAAFAVIPNELLADSALPVATLIANLIAEAFAKKLDEEILDGDSTDATNHRFDGWSNAANVKAVTGDVDATPTFAELLTEDNLLAFRSLLSDEALQGAEFFWNDQAWEAVRAIEDGAGSEIIRLNEAFEYNLFAKPTTISSRILSGTAAANGVAGLFGNPKHIIVGDRMNMTIDYSDQYRFGHDQTVFRGLQRIAIKVGIPTALAKIKFGAAA